MVGVSVVNPATVGISVVTIIEISVVSGVGTAQ